MTTDQSLFNQDNTSATPTTQNPQNDNPLAHLLANIKNEAGTQKYSTVEDALNGAAHAQAYIAQLKREKEEAERKAQEALGAQDKTAQLEATLAELMAKVNNPATPTTQLDPSKIDEYVSNALTAREAAQAAKTNQSKVVDAFVAEFGSLETAGAKFDAVAESLGLSRAELNAMAAKSPALVLKAAGLGEKKNNTSIFPPESKTNLPAFQPHQDSAIKRNPIQLGLGHTTEDVKAASAFAKKMVEELNSQGMSVYDLTDPKVYFKVFGK